jgi:signal transduction histidine kinase
MSDITERKRAEEALKEYSERLEIMVAERTHALEEAHERLLRQERLAVLGQLAGGVAHELRSPLATIENGVYFLNVVLDKPEPEVQETLDILSKEVGRSEGIIAGLLDFAHPKAPLRRPVDVNGVVRETLARIAAPANVKTTCQLDAVLPTILADPDQLLQVFSNLILNAIQAMPDGGELTVKTVATNPERVSIAIADTGSGIPHENLSKLFEPLFTTKSKGIGLGLAISKKLMEEHKGTIEVQSEEGQGTTFTVHLPVQETPAMPTSEVTS